MEPNTIAANGGSESITNEASLRSITMIAYVLLGLGMFTGATSIAAVVIAYAKRGEASGTIYESHMTWLIRTFWLSLIAGVIGCITLLIGIGFLILLACGAWFIYRVVIGYLRFNDRKPIDNPSRFF